jgi:tetratricopeptide (TPR) repeat protein
MVYNYFSTCGADKSSLNTPKTHLQYYGQVFDNLTTTMIHWFNIEDIYSFRHLMSSLAGWLTILVTALFAASVSGYGAAIVVLALFAVSPSFMGQAQNNLKDIPFALAYIASTFYALKLVFDNEKPSLKTILLLILSIGFSIGIRPGGVLVVFYLGLFMFLKLVLKWLQDKKPDFLLLKKYAILFGSTVVPGYLLGIVNWPYALQNPVTNVWKSYKVMTHFPTTVRQIFEGRFDWSDLLPWYYLPKYMAITIPIVVFAGILIFFLNTRKNYPSGKKIQIWMLGFTIVFPVVFVLIKESNLYGSWRHFLFIYPGIVLFAALGFYSLIQRFKRLLGRISVIVALLALSFHPLKFMATNHPYYYLYYNELVGGLKGAYTNYETDYYYHSLREGAEWLQEYLKNKPDTGQIVVGSNFPVQWYFRNNNAIKTAYFTYQKRSAQNWDYAIVANSYIPPFQLKNDIWPPENTLHTIDVDGVPVCAVIERRTKDDLAGIQELEKGDYIKSALLFEKALELDPQNEWIVYKFAASLAQDHQNEKAEKMLEKSLELNPEFEPALLMLGDLSMKENDRQKAAAYFRNVISANRKNFEAYVKLAKTYPETGKADARKVLKECLKYNPKYKPAIKALAESYRDTDPGTARKYERILERIK